MTETPMEAETTTRRPAGPRKAGDGTWWFVVSLPKDADGKRHQARRRGFRTRKDAQAAFDELARTKVAPSKRTTGDYMVTWLTGRHDLRPGTAKRYAILIRRHVTPVVGHIAIQKLEASDLNRLYTTMLTASPPLSARTVRFVHSVIRKALADGVRSDELARNVADRANPPSTKAAKAPETAHWSEAELRAFLDLTADHELACLFRLAAMSGLRRGELGAAVGRRRLRRRAADCALRTGQDRGEWAPRAPKTDRAKRTIGVDPATVAALRKHRQAQLEQRFALGAGWQDHDLVFAGVTGAPADIDLWTSSFARAVKAWGGKRITFHGLRHTHATFMLGHTDVSTLSARLGHATPGFTLAVYGHPRDDSGAVAAMAAALDGVTTK